MIATNNCYVNGAISMKKTIATKTAERLGQTQEGLALLGLLEKHGTPSDLAKKLDVDAQAVRQWVYAGAIPKGAAIKAASVLKIKAAALRPDLPASAWEVKAEEEKPARKPVARTEDARLLVALADKFGTVKDLCAAAHCTVSEFHTWKTRGRIPAIKLPTFLALNQ